MDRFNRCRGLADFPFAGRLRNDLRTKLRLVAFEPGVAIAYGTTADRVEMYRIFYGGRDIGALLSEPPDAR